jgi:hypothetical protein
VGALSLLYPITYHHSKNSLSPTIQKYNEIEVFNLFFDGKQLVEPDMQRKDFGNDEI